MASTKVPIELSSTPGIVDNSNATAITIDSSENVGIGVTPVSAEGSFLQFGSQYSISQRGFGRNTYFDGSNYRAIVTGGATLTVGGDDHIFYTASSVSAGATQAFTERMRIDSSGNVGIGESAPANPLHVKVSDVGLAPIDTALLVLEKSGTNLINFMGSSTSTQGLRFGDSSDTGAGYLVYNHTDNALQIGTNGPEKMRIDSSGNLLVGTTSTYGVANNGLVVAGSSMNNSNVGMLHIRSLDSGETADECIASFVSYRNDSTTSNVFIKFAIDQYNAGCGQINANGAAQAAFGSFSDSRLKENIVDLPNQLDNIKSLRPVEFDYIESEGGGHQIGFIAQEVEEIYPDLVGERGDGMKTLTGIGKMEARLIKAIQEQQVLIEQLQAEVALLKGE